MIVHRWKSVAVCIAACLTQAPPAFGQEVHKEVAGEQLWNLQNTRWGTVGESDEYTEKARISLGRGYAVYSCRYRSSWSVHIDLGSAELAEATSSVISVRGTRTLYHDSEYLDNNLTEVILRSKNLNAPYPSRSDRARADAICESKPGAIGSGVRKSTAEFYSESFRGKDYARVGMKSTVTSCRGSICDSGHNQIGFVASFRVFLFDRMTKMRIDPDGYVLYRK